jgi:MIP family channel proteins
MNFMGANGILSKALAEFFAMLLFVFIGVGTAMTPTRSVFQIALAFGMGIVILAYSIGNKSGGHVNCAVTTALMVAGKCPIVEGIVIIVFQFLGSIAGAGLLAATIPDGKDATKCFGTNHVADGFSDGNAFCGEFFLTFLLLFVVFHTAVHKGYSKQTANAAPLAIGMSVFCAHCVLIPITGCSINPTRTFGPAVLSAFRDFDDNDCHQWRDIWIFFLAPESAALVAGLLWRFLWSTDEPGQAEEPCKDECEPTEAVPAPAPERTMKGPAKVKRAPSPPKHSAKGGPSMHAASPKSGAKMDEDLENL